jgi:hypothetical protein
MPDIVVEPAVLESAEADNLRIKEANLSGHLENEATHKANNKVADKPMNDNDVVEWLRKDNQLHDALNVLKAIHISQQSLNSIPSVPGSTVVEP